MSDSIYEVMSNKNPEFEYYEPGVYSEEDQKILDAFQKSLDAINNRGELDVMAVINGEISMDAPEILCKTFYIDPYECRVNALAHDPKNPVYFNLDAALKAGYEKIPATPVYHTDYRAFLPSIPRELKDYMVVSGLSHVVTLHKPVYGGDTVYYIPYSRSYEDITPDPGIYRTFALYGYGKAYNQNGELLFECRSQCKESLRRFKDREKAKEVLTPWECPSWWARPRHYYTLEDWDFIKGVWSKEHHQAGETLYWEDVNVGDVPAWTLNGPIVNEDLIRLYAIDDIITWPDFRTHLEDPEMAKRLHRDPVDGIYYERVGPFEHIDDGRFPEARASFYNTLNRDFACTMLNNWIGYHGRIKTIGWGIMTDMPGYEHIIPDLPNYKSPLDKVPGMEGRRVDIHGVAGDIALNKAYVTEKYVDEDGEHIAELVWWSETIEGEIYAEGTAKVVLPTKV